jgi:hypothetical protein
MNGKKQTRKPERGLEIELQRGRSRQERPFGIKRV